MLERYSGPVAELLIWIRERSLVEAALLSLLVNLAVFAVALAFGAAVTRAFRHIPVGEPPGPITSAERWLALTCVALNSVVMFAGWLAFREGWLRVRGNTTVPRALLDALALLLVMDLGMYATHRLAHHPLVFRYVHHVHHRYERVRALNLFTLHPLEVLGFGGLWLAVLLCYDFSVSGILLYLTLNTAFGVIGHVGVEPCPARFRALPLFATIGSSTFHAHHHQRPQYNFGFYTNIWDRLFNTLTR